MSSIKTRRLQPRPHQKVAHKVAPLILFTSTHIFHLPIIDDLIAFNRILCGGSKFFPVICNGNRHDIRYFVLL